MFFSSLCLYFILAITIPKPPQIVEQYFKIDCAIAAKYIILRFTCEYLTIVRRYNTDIRHTSKCIYNHLVLSVDSRR